MLFLLLVETVVFLRTLASYKIPAVIERRRKELLDKLCLLQEDTIKEAPPIIEPQEEKPLPQAAKEETPLIEKVLLRETPRRSSSKSERGESPDSITSPTHGGRLAKRNSKISSLIKDYESIHFSAKKEETDETPKRLVMLKKVSKPVDYRRTSTSSPEPPNEEPEGGEKEGGKKGEAEATKDDVTDSGGMVTLEVDASRERAPSVTSTEDCLDDIEGEESEKGGDKKKKKSKLPFSFKNKKKRDKSPAPERKLPPLEPAGEEAEPPQDPEEEEEVQLADGVKICGVLERNKKKGLGHKKVKIDAQVFHTMLILGGKEELDLANCSLEETGSGFDLTHPQHRSVMVFKVDGPEDEKQKWVAVLKETIAEATPAKEEEEGKAVWLCIHAGYSVQLQ